jgi:hypothetical protein
MVSVLPEAERKSRVHVHFKNWGSRMAGVTYGLTHFDLLVDQLHLFAFGRSLIDDGGSTIDRRSYHRLV